MRYEINVFTNLVLALFFICISSQLGANESVKFILSAEEIDQLHQAVANNDVSAIHMLGALYITGQGIEKDIERGTDLIQSAADRGFANSQLIIAVMYNTGNGAYKKDKVKSLAWAMMAKAQGLERAEDYYQYVASESSPDELRNAVELYEKLATAE